MESVPFSGDSEGHESKYVMGQYGAPAYIRRARGVEEALEYLLLKCRGQREAWLGMVKLYLGRLLALAGEWPALRPLVADDEQLAVLETLRQELRPRLRLPPERTTSARVLRYALRELVSSLERFNRRWQAYLEKLDFAAVNEVRDGYNRYYVLEKSCALRNDVLATLGFVPLAPMTLAELTSHLPPLPVPRLAG
jgi:hypothetical protein